MMRMIQNNSADQAKAYFTDALAKSDYYVSDQELPGIWQGKLAERLGLSGHTERDDFFALCENKNPKDGERLTLANRENRRTGYDINFHCPKSVSVLHALSGDDHIFQLFRDSVTETMQRLEADAQTRVRKDGRNEDRTTGELVWGHFVHQTARPVEDHAPDPHLHSHCFVFNATYDPEEKQYKAAELGGIKRDMPYYQAQFHKTLSDKLVAAGYSIRSTKSSFEIEGVPQRVIDLFSKRTDEIGRVAKEKGITDAKELDALGSRTRSKKQKGLTMEDLKANWRGQIAALGGGDKGELEAGVRFTLDKELSQRTPEDCLNYAVQHCFERFSVVEDRKLLQAAIRFSLGSASVTTHDIEKAFREDARIIHVQEHGRTLCTTKEVLAEEKRMVQLARAGQGKLTPICRDAPELSLTGQQAAAVNHVLTTTDRVSIIRGAAGSGKTTLMKEAKAQLERAGKEMIVVAPTAEASRGVLVNEGFAGAETVARFLIDPKMQERVKGQVLWVDEAGLLGTKDMTALLEVASKNNARLVLGGDTRQHASVVRGDALRILNTVAGIRSAEVNKIYRQKNAEYRAAVEDLARVDVAAGFKKLDNLKFIKEEDPTHPNAQLVSDYVEAVKRGKEALIIAPTHKQGEAVTEAVREQLKAAGLLHKTDKIVSRLVGMTWTEAEKQDGRNYQAGQVIQFTQNAKGFQRGSRWAVEEVTAGGITVTQAGERKNIPWSQSQRFAVYQPTEIDLAKRDKVRITNNGFDLDGKRLNNGQTFEVVGISRDGTIQLQHANGGGSYKIDASFGHIAHAHCITSHASQGKTIDEIFISQPSATFGATDAKQFYVSVSRGKERAHIYTDDKDALLDHASRLGERQAALEVFGPRQDQEVIRHKSRHKEAETPQVKPEPKKQRNREYEPPEL